MCNPRKCEIGPCQPDSARETSRRPKNRVALDHNIEKEIIELRLAERQIEITRNDFSAVKNEGEEGTRLNYNCW